MGSVALDSVKTPLGAESQVLGGSATYFSISASFFAPVNLVAVVGEDFPRKYRKLFESRGINTEGLLVLKGKTFRWKGRYDWDFADPKTLYTRLNVFSEFNPRIPRQYKSSKYLFLANIDPQIQERVLRQLEPKLVACDTMNYWIENKRNRLLRILKKADIFLLNESEARMLTRQRNIAKAAQELIRLGPRLVIVKRGEHGCLLFSDKYVFSIPGFLLETIVDPTGAGDTFAGGLLGYLALNNKLTREALRMAIAYGSVMASFAVEDFSVRRLLSVSRQDITRRFNQFRKLCCF